MDNKPLPRRSRQRLFKGRSAGVWSRHLREAGWPPVLASALAQWVTGEGPLPNYRAQVAADPEDDYAERAEWMSRLDRRSR